MPRPRKYDYQKDYPVRTVIYVNLPVEILNELEEMGLQNKKLSNAVESFLITLVENNRKNG